MIGQQVENPGIENLSLVPPLNGSIRYHKRGNLEYASYEMDTYVANGSTYHHSVYLGKIINSDEHLYFNNRTGYFHFTLESGFVRRYDMIRDLQPDKLHLRYGDIWVYDDILNKNGFNKVIDNILIPYNDTLNALIAFRLADGSPYCYAQEWYDESYAKVKYPRANMSSASISTFLAALGDEANYRRFTSLYLNFLNKDTKFTSDKKFPVLIDSTGMPNSIHVDKTEISTHGGAVSNEIRLIFVVDKESGLPIYFKLIPGNVIDNSTLKTTLAILQANNMNIKFVIMDAGYTSLSNLEYLNSLNIQYVTRMPENLKIYKSIIHEHSNELYKDINSIVRYNDRKLYCKQVEVIINKIQYYAYLCIDIDRLHTEFNSYLDKYSIGYKQERDTNIDYMKNIETVSDKLDSFGRFILVSNSNISNQEIVNTYYSRQRIEQIFDVTKNNANLLPLRCHSDETLRGHLMITFIVTIINLLISKKLSNIKLNPYGIFHAMRGLYINIYDNSSIVDEPKAAVSNVIEALNLVSPFKMEKRNQKNTKLYIIDSKRKKGRPKGSFGKEKKYRMVEPPSMPMDTISNEELTEVNSSDTPTPNVKRSRGRPKGSTKNKLNTDNPASNNANSQVKRSRGRPKGSTKNKLNTDNLSSNNSANSQVKRSRGRPKGSTKNMLNTDNPSSNSATSQFKRSRGRPKGSTKNKLNTDNSAYNSATSQGKRSRGRPRGTKKNK
jgi:hypothetical protein